jgi:hypothetical protein
LNVILSVLRNEALHLGDRLQRDDGGFEIEISFSDQNGARFASLFENEERI